MIRNICAYIGICSLTIGLVTLLFDESLPERLQISFLYSVLFVLVGVVLAYYGRHYLKNWLAYLLLSSDDQ